MPLPYGVLRWGTRVLAGLMFFGGASELRVLERMGALRMGTLVADPGSAMHLGGARSGTGFAGEAEGRANALAWTSGPLFTGVRLKVLFSEGRRSKRPLASCFEHPIAAWRDPLGAQTRLPSSVRCGIMCQALATRNGATTREFPTPTDRSRANPRRSKEFGRRKPEALRPPTKHHVRHTQYRGRDERRKHRGHQPECHPTPPLPSRSGPLCP